MADDQVAELQKKCQELEDRLATQRSMTMKLNEEKYELEDQIEELREELEEARTEGNSSAPIVAGTDTAAIQELDAKAKLLASELEVRDAQLQDLRSELARAKEGSPGGASGAVTNLQIENEGLKEQISSMERRVAEATEKARDARVLSAELEEAKSRIGEVEHERDGLLERVSALEHQLEDLRSAADSGASASQRMDELQQKLQAALDTAETERSARENELQIGRKREAHIRELEERLSQLDGEAHRALQSVQAELDQMRIEKADAERTCSKLQRQIERMNERERRTSSVLPDSADELRALVATERRLREDETLRKTQLEIRLRSALDSLKVLQSVADAQDSNQNGSTPSSDESDSDAAVADRDHTIRQLRDEVAHLQQRCEADRVAHQNQLQKLAQSVASGTAAR